MEHLPVLRDNVQKYLNLKKGETVVDATLGLGGHSSDILKKIGKNGLLIAFDQDERNLNEARERLADYKNQIQFVHDNFCHLKTGVAGKEIHAILFDLGLSSPHVDEAERGFSFLKEGPLDMRFDQRNPLTAADVINTYPEKELAQIFFDYAEEKYGRKIASQIVKRRSEKPFITTTELAGFLEDILPKKRSKKSSSAHPATKVFQALRMEVNKEMEVLTSALEQAMELLKLGGRIVVISYHSVEDRIVKKFFKELEKPPASGEEAIYSTTAEPIVEALTRKPVTPAESEIVENPRSRSAKLRAYKKLKKY